MQYLRINAFCLDLKFLSLLLISDLVFLQYEYYVHIYTLTYTVYIPQGAKTVIAGANVIVHLLTRPYIKVWVD